MNKKLWVAIGFTGILAGIGLIISLSQPRTEMYLDLPSPSWWEIQSIDTVKFSRDLAREKGADTSFGAIIEAQVASIASTGVTHIALGTPLDEEFVPFLTRWVEAARRHGLSIWFRSNFSGWEGWFEYPAISREQHLELARNFIINHGNLFADGDLFSACTECENGGPGDPRQTGDVTGHRLFLIEEYKTTKDAFRLIGKNVRSNFFPMNGDVARLIMNRQTTQALGGIVVIDHYVATPSQLAEDIVTIANVTGGKIFLGEFGVPIPVIHGSITEDQQAAWVQDALAQLSEIPQLIGLNYWVSYGGSTKLWEDNNEPRAAALAILQYFRPKPLSGLIVNETGRPVAGANLTLGPRNATSGKDGRFILPMVADSESLTITAKGYQDLSASVTNNSGALTGVTVSDEQTGRVSSPNTGKLNIALVKDKESIFYSLIKFIRRLGKKF